MAYTKPVLKSLSMETEQSGCCFFFTNSGQGVYIYTEGGSTGLPGLEVNPDGINPGAAAGNPVATVGSDGGASVTPLCGTGLPATQPIIFGVPVGVTGVGASIGPGGVDVSLNSEALGVSVLGGQLPVPV
jgi:hypothetical protein